MEKFWKSKELRKLESAFKNLESHYRHRRINYLKKFISASEEDMLDEAKYLKWFLGNNQTPGELDELDREYRDCFLFSKQSHRHFESIGHYAFELYSKILRELPAIDTHEL